MTSAQRPRASLVPYEPLSLPALLRRTAARLPAKIAVIDGPRRFTFAEINALSDRFAAALAQAGVGLGDRVGILAPNCAEFVIAFHGVVKAGAAATTINSGYREREVAYQLSNSGAETLIVHHTLAGLAALARDGAPAVKRVIVIEDGSRNADSFWGRMESAPQQAPAVTVDPARDVAALPYSSGTTGLTKGVMLTHLNLTSSVRHMSERAGEVAAPGGGDVLLAHLPMFHIFGINVYMNVPLCTGGAVVMMGRFDPDLFLQQLAAHHVTKLVTVPPVALALVQHPHLGRYDLSALRAVMIGGAPTSADTQQKLSDALGVPVTQGYGLTEFPLVTHDYGEPDLARSGSVGAAAPDTEIRLISVDDERSDVPPGESGEIWARGPQCMLGYHGNAAATAETITPDGWLRTGDIGRMDGDGYLWVHDRKKELIKYKGFQVPPAELEGLLLEHPAVADAAVIGVPDAAAGELPKAYIVAKPGSHVTGDDLMAFVAAKVATFKRIRLVEFIDQVPKTPSGKILRRVLKERGQATDQ